MKHAEQRQHPRIKPPKSVVVAWQSGTHRDVCYVENLALGGLYVRTKQRIPLRSAVQILLDMPVGQVRGRAVVRRLADHGMGIEIIAMDPSDRARLRQQLRELNPSA
jgi:PilZ domain-containing protein